jgi:hypothetical protein
MWGIGVDSYSLLTTQTIHSWCVCSSVVGKARTADYTLNTLAIPAYICRHRSIQDPCFIFKHCQMLVKTKEAMTTACYPRKAVGKNAAPASAGILAWLFEAHIRFATFMLVQGQALLAISQEPQRDHTTGSGSRVARDFPTLLLRAQSCRHTEFQAV